MTAATVVPVRPPGSAAYDVVIGADWVSPVLAAVEGRSRVAVIAPASAHELAAHLLSALGARGIAPLELGVPDGEAAKEIGVAQSCWDALGGAGFTRDDAVVGIGGGATTDLAGFVAATWLRGISVVHVATSTAGMVDAAIGGKTAVNVAAGKNLVGAFHQPRLVVCPLPALRSLPIEHHRAGLAEVVKTGFIADEEILAIIEADPAAALDVSSPAVAELVERSVRVKAGVVGDDPREAGRREILNYGHTLGHAIERAEHYRWRHGDAVAVGLCFAAALGERAGVSPAGLLRRQRDMLRSLGLPTSYGGAARDELVAAMRVDKKARGDRLRFVVLAGVGQPVILDDPDPGWLDGAFEEVGA